MNLKELLGRIRDTKYFPDSKETHTLKNMGITQNSIALIDLWTKSMTSYGLLATYIPELKKVNKDLTAIAIGDVHKNKVIVGDGTQIKISAQSVIKPFLYLYALEKGIPAKHISGMEATAMPFNTDKILQPELESKTPEHPLNNAGAISAAGAITDFDDFIAFISRLTGNSKIEVLTPVFKSEFSVNNNNRAIANRLVASGRFKNTAEGEKAYTHYTKACSLGLTVAEVLHASLVVASGGVTIHSNKRVAKMNNVVRVMSAMNTYGLYEQSGIISLMVSGARANTSKSSVSGLIININPGIGAFVTYSPLLNCEGNSVYGVYAMIPLNNLLALPGGMRLDAEELHQLLTDYSKEESEKVHQKIIYLMKKGENSTIFRTDPKSLQELARSYTLQVKNLTELA